VVSDPITPQEFVEILALGERQDLNEAGPATDREKRLLIKLYGVAREGSCVPETEWVCAYDYYLAVSEYGIDALQGAFRIGFFGEIRGIQWLSERTPESYDSARLRLQVANYPSHAVKANPELREAVRTIELVVTAVGVREGRP